MSAVALGILDSGTQIDIPTSEPGIGKVILSPSSAELIGGVEVKPFALWPDDRGYFLEVARLAQGLIAGFPSATTQISAALNYPGIIKAFHFHKFQTDCWVPAAGLLQVALGGFAPRFENIRDEEHSLRRRLTALAIAHPAGSGARLQGHWRAAIRLDLRDQPHLRSKR